MSEGPRVFISYAWEDKAHVRWVEGLAIQLRDSGADVLLDKWQAKEGTDLGAFMEKAVTQSDLVIPVCTPEYKARAEGIEGRGSGVLFEVGLMRGEALVLRRNDKFIPILRWGTWDRAAPAWLLSSYFIDCRDPNAEVGQRQLIERVMGEEAVRTQSSLQPGLGMLPVKAIDVDPKLTAILEDELGSRCEEGIKGFRRLGAEHEWAKAGQKAGIARVLISRLRSKQGMLRLRVAIGDVASAEVLRKAEFDAPADDPEEAEDVLLSDVIPWVLASSKETAALAPGPMRRVDPEQAFRAAVRALRFGDPDEIRRREDEVDDALELEGDRANLWAARALLLHARWRTTGADSLIGEGLSAARHSLKLADGPWSRLAEWTWATAQGEHEQAWAAAHALKERLPHDALGHVLSAESCLSLRRWDEALQAVDKALRLEPFGSAELVRLRAEIRVRMGDAESARPDRVWLEAWESRFGTVRSFPTSPSIGGGTPPSS